MLKATRTTLKKLEEIFVELKYKVRYEKGNFNSGYCIVEDRNIVIINKFFDIKGRINAMQEILQKLNVSAESLSPHCSQHYKQILTSDFSSENAMALAI